MKDGSTPGHSGDWDNGAYLLDPYDDSEAVLNATYTIYHNISFQSQQYFKTNTVIPVLQIRKLRNREGK